MPSRGGGGASGSACPLSFEAVMNTSSSRPYAVELPGLRVSIAARPERLQSAFEWLFQLCPTASGAADLRIEADGMCTEAVERCMPEWLRAWLPGTVEGAMPLLVAGPTGEVATLGRFDGLVFCAVAQFCQGSLRLLCSMRDGGNRTRSIIPSLLVPLLREVLAARGRFLLHAAAVEIEPGAGILLIAPSGGGKTTTTLALVRQGARLVSDDLVVLDVATGQPWAHGIPKLLNVREPTLGFFDELRRCDRAEQRLPGRSSLSPVSVYGAACTTPSCRLQAIYCLSLSSGSIEASQLGIEQAMERLVHGHTFSSTQTTGARSVLAFLDVLSHVPAYHVGTGDDPDRLGRWLKGHSMRQGASARAPSAGVA